MSAFSGGFSIGLFYICNRKLATGTPAIVMLAHSVIVGAVLFGFFVLGEFPDIWTVPGIAVVVGSGIYIAVREGRVKKT